IERMHKDRLPLPAVLLGGGRRLVVGGSHQPNLDRGATELLDPIDLLERGDGGHEDGPPDSQVRTGEGHPLGVVPGTGAYHASLLIVRREGGDLVVGSPDLERANLMVDLP